MPLPFALALLYLAINLGLMVWLERGRAQGREPAVRVATLSMALRWGPPLAGVIYLEAVAGDWVFLLFVLAFFAGAFWLLDGLLAVTNSTPGGGAEAMRSGWDDRTTGKARGGRTRG